MPSLRGTLQFWSIALQLCSELALVDRWARNSEGFGDAGSLGDVGVVAGLVETVRSVPCVSRDKAVDLGKVYPRQQVGIVCRVWPSVAGEPGHAPMYSVNSSDCPLGLGSRPEGRGSKEIGGPLQPAPWVGSIVAVRRYTSHGKRMQ